MVYEDEASIGNAYPMHKWYAIGELNAAAKEVAMEYPILAQMTREHAKSYEIDNVPVPTYELIELATGLAEGEEKEEEIEKSFAEKVHSIINNSEDGE